MGDERRKAEAEKFGAFTRDGWATDFRGTPRMMRLVDLFQHWCIGLLR